MHDAPIHTVKYVELKGGKGTKRPFLLMHVASKQVHIRQPEQTKLEQSKTSRVLTKSHTVDSFFSRKKEIDNPNSKEKIRQYKQVYTSPEFLTDCSDTGHSSGECSNVEEDAIGGRVTPALRSAAEASIISKVAPFS